MKPELIVISFLILGVPLFGLGQSIITIDTLENGNIHVITSQYECVIFNTNNNSFNVGSLEKKWLPSVEDVLLCDNIIKDYVHFKEKKGAAVLGDSPVISENYYKYVRQYMGYIDKRGRKIMAVKYIWQEIIEINELQWLNRRIDVIGGGTYFWQIEVRLKCKRCFNFHCD